MKELKEARTKGSTKNRKVTPVAPFLAVLAERGIAPKHTLPRIAPHRPAQASKISPKYTHQSACPARYCTPPPLYPTRSVHLTLLLHQDSSYYTLPRFPAYPAHYPAPALEARRQGLHSIQNSPTPLPVCVATPHCPAHLSWTLTE